MKKILAALLIITTVSTQAQVKNVLFLGNSYTSSNNLPNLVKEVALSFGDTMSTDQYVPGGKQLVQHASDATTLSKIASTSPTGGGARAGSPVAASSTPAPQMMSGAFELSGGVEPEPTRAYVVTDEMTNSQNQLANIRRRATI